jgi:hypothetical protein
MRSVAIALVALSVLMTSVYAQQTATTTSPIPLAGLTASEREIAEKILPIPKLDPKAVVASLEVTAPVRFVLGAIANASGVNLRFDPTVPEAELNRSSTVKLSNATAEEAFGQALKSHPLAFKAIVPNSAIIYPDTPEGRAKYVESIRTFTIAHADVGALAMLLNKTFTTGQVGTARPIILPVRESHTISVRATGPVMDAVARMIAENDK